MWHMDNAQTKRVEFMKCLVTGGAGFIGSHVVHTLHNKIKKFLGYEVHTSLKEGLERMAKWAKKQPNKKAKNFNKVEIKEVKT